MNTLIVWNHEKLISLKGFDFYFFHRKTALSSKYYVPLIRTRQTRFDYDDVNAIINSTKQDPGKKVVHVILLSANDIVLETRQDELFDTCSILTEHMQKYPNAHLLFITFFPLPLRFTEQITKVTRFQTRLRKLTKSQPNVTLRCNNIVQDSLLRLDSLPRQTYVEKFYKEILYNVTSLNR
jgi:hypothetical protein